MNFDLFTNWKSDALLATLLELQEYNGVVDIRLLKSKPSSMHCAKTNPCDGLLVQLFGLPGSGKSTLFCRIFDFLHAEGLKIFAMPEAANFAVDRKGYSLNNMEKLLTPLYKRAEKEAIRLAYRIPGLITLREPAKTQNDAYLDIQQIIRERSESVKFIEHLANCFCSGTWEPLSATRLISELKRAVVAENRWKWPGKRIFIHLTTGVPLDDLFLSIDRQKNPDRDPRLCTTDPVYLCGYKAALELLNRHLSTKGHLIFTLNPILPQDDQLPIVINHITGALSRR